METFPKILAMDILRQRAGRISKDSRTARHYREPLYLGGVDWAAELSLYYIYRHLSSETLMNFKSFGSKGLHRRGRAPAQKRPQDNRRSCAKAHPIWLDCHHLCLAAPCFKGSGRSAAILWAFAMLLLAVRPQSLRQGCYPLPVQNLW